MRAAKLWFIIVGLRALEIGDEAVIDTATFSLNGRGSRNLRQTVNRVERLGVAVRLSRVDELTSEERGRLSVLADSWRKGKVERGYSMALGRVCNEGDGKCLLAVATWDDVPCGILQFVPWGSDGLSLDLMRRSSEAPNGVMELLIAAVLSESPQFGVTRVSLNFAPFRSALSNGERMGAGPLSRTWRRTLLIASHWMQIETLFRFNGKFNPRWEPRFIMYSANRDFGRVVVAYLRLEAILPRPARFNRGNVAPRP